MSKKIKVRKKLPKKGFSSSLLQQNFGEKPENHGLLIWEIEDKTNFNVKEINIPNDYSHITFNLDKEDDYSNLNLESEFITPKSKVRVIWSDYPVNITTKNEEKIRKYIFDKFGCKLTKLERRPIITEIKDVGILTESVNVKDPQVQKDIFREYLKKNEYKESFIQEILKIDEEISSRIDVSDDVNNVIWTIEEMTLDNFKSYGDNNNITFKDKSGIIQINGKNQEGKSTILDGITYILHGTTLSTNKLGGGKTEKAGDNRFINNKRDLDFCKGHMIIKFGEQVYTLLRRTDRTFTKSGGLKSASTVLDIWKGREMVDGNLLKGESKAETEELLKNIISDFDDFIRIVLTNADNLNTLLSLNRATFIDSIIKDAGYDVFEKKLNEFKNFYRKEQEKDNININVEDKKSIKESNTNDIGDIVKHIIEVEKIIDENEQLLNDLKISKTNKLKKLHKIDENIYNIDVDDLKDKIETNAEEIKKLVVTKKLNIEKIDKLKSTYDKNKLENFYKELKKYDEDVLDYKLEISNIEKSISYKESFIDKIKSAIENLKTEEINKNLKEKREYEYANKNNLSKIENLKKDKIDELNGKLKDVEHRISEINLSLSNIKENGISIKKEIKEIETSTFCPTCGRDYEDTDHNHTKKIIEEKQNKIKELFEKVKPLQNELAKRKGDIDILKDDISKLENDEFYEYPELEEKILSIKSEITANMTSIDNIKYINEEIRNNKFRGLLEKNIKEEMEKEVKVLEEIVKLNEEIKEIKNKIRVIESKKDDLGESIYTLERDREEVKTHEHLLNENEKITLKVDNFKLSIEKINTLLEKHNKQYVNIQENKEIEEEIEKIDQEILLKESIVETYKEDVANKETKMAILEKENKDIESDLKKFYEQEKKAKIFDEYQKCVHRTGIPTYLLKKSISLINNKLSTLLRNVDFSVFFDEDLNLKMSPENRPDVIQNAIECSGKERTFTACALKIALRSINHRSKPDFILLDEIMGKLVESSIDEFLEFLDLLKEEIDKIIIIEHNHPINYDHVIEVEKDVKGVSSLKMF